MIVKIYTHASELPEMQYVDFFHSKELMSTYEHTPRHKPFMVVAFENGQPIAHLLAVRHWLKCKIFGEGDYVYDADKEKVFDEMLSALAHSLSFPKTLFIQVSDLSRKMFAYKYLKWLHFIPIHWLQVHNSLHSRSPEERIDKKLLRQIAYARMMKVSTTLVSSLEDLDDFYHTTRRYYYYQLRKYCPPKIFFEQLLKNQNIKFFISWFHGRPIATMAIVCTQSSESDKNDGCDAYLWFGAYKKKSHPRLHPDVVTIWNVMNWCYENDIRHFRFMDVGLPFLKNKYYEFIMRFGGKCVGTNRWFHFYPSIINKILQRIINW